MFPIGTTVVTWTVTDNAGLTATCTQNVTVTDDENPTITCPSDQNVNFDTNCEYALLDYTGLATTNDNCDTNVTVTQSPSAGTLITGTTLVTLTATDDEGNTSACTFSVIPTDNINPTALCQDITVQLSATGNVTINATDIDNNSYDNCGIQSISVSPNTFDCSNVGNNTVTLTVTDTSGNTSTCTATVTVEDNTAPTNNPTECGSIGPLVLDAVTGEVTVTQAQINASYSGSDVCGIGTLVLSQSTFGCADIGTNTVQLTITDINGNVSTCNVSITIEAPTIDGGIVTGYLDVTNPEPASSLIEVTFCPYDNSTDPPTPTVQNAIFNLTIDPSLVPNIIQWQIATYNPATTLWDWVDDGINTANRAQHTVNNVTETTFVRAVIQSGNCIAYSSVAELIVIPPDEPPIILGVTSNTACFPQEYTINAESYYDYYGQFGDTGLFNHAQVEGWLVDGVANDIPASGNNTNQSTWKEVAQEKVLAGIRHYPQEGSKFATVYGPVNSTLETPVFSTIGMTAAQAKMEYYQAFYLCPGASILVELSLDGGTNYTETIFSYTGQSDTGITIVRPSGNANNCNNYDPINDGYEFISIDLSPYLNEGTLRVKFSFFGAAGGTCSGTFNDSSGTLPCSSITRTVSSSWAIDGLTMPSIPVDEILEWTDEFGNVIQIGNTVTVTPVTPGTQEYGVTTLVEDCRLDSDDGTQFITLDVNLAYAGKDFTPQAGECGQSTIDLKAYDNTKTALENYDNGNGAWEPGLYIYPGQSYDHDNDNSTPNVVAPNYPGTGMTGTWSYSVVSQNCATFTPTFSSNSSPTASFTAPPGEYDLTWTLQNGCTDTIRVNITSCDKLDFDGADDFVSFKNNYSLNNIFSIEAWVKPNSITGNNTIFSKRLAGNTNQGYDLSLQSNSRVRFSWFTSGADGYIESNYAISTNRWYHLAVTFNGSTYKLYIDGIDVGTVNGSISAPEATNGNVECLLGALDPNIGTSSIATNNYHGWIDELRIWNKALTTEQIRIMMNQEIDKDSGSNSVRGEIIPQNIPNLLWTTDLIGYYRMNKGCGDLAAEKGPSGRLRNIFTDQTENAPLPYTSRVDGQNWETDNSWTHFSVWDAPNSIGVDGSTPIDWNIVQLSHNMNSGNKDITVLGLISDTTNKELTIANPGTPQDETNDGQMLWITHYFKLNGRLDLVGESQLIQKRYNSSQVLPSIFDNTSTGYAERDQQGTVNPFNYNYFSSPFSPNNATVNNENTSNTFSIGGVLRDGTTTVADPINRNIVWTPSYTSAGGNPTQVSTRWLYAYNDNAGNTYSEWEYLNNSGSLNIGLGYTMKGSGNATAMQNYVFVGKPNNGTISNNVSPENAGLANDILLGNPYPSAIDANEFIKDNIPLLNPDNSPSQANSDTSESINGTLYFWEHYAANNTHILRDYQGGYATYNLSGGLQATTPPPTEDGVIIVGGSGTVIPKRYIPVAQGFFVTGSPTGGLIKFHNDQRVFVKETGSSSVFFEPNNTVQETEINTNNNNGEIKRVRLTFKSPEGAERQLLLAFTPNNEADDNYNYGYDAPNYDDFPSDLSWSIDNERYVIQGVGQFDSTKKYPFILEIGNSGEIEISLDDLENFDSAINVYIYDALLETYTRFNESPFVATMSVADYTDRFYLAFSNEENLSTSENEIESIRVYYLNDTKEIYINWVNSYDIEEVKLINILGQTVKTYTDLEPINSYEIKIPVKNISDGNYVIKVKNSYGMTTNKKVIIKQ